MSTSSSSRRNRPVYVVLFQNFNGLGKKVESLNVIGVFETSRLARERAAQYLDGVLDQVLNKCEPPLRSGEERRIARTQWVLDEWKDGDDVWTRERSTGDRGRQLVVKVTRCRSYEGT